MKNEEDKIFNFYVEKEIGEALGGTTELSQYCSSGIDLAYLFSDKDTNIPKIQLFSDDKENKLTIYSNQESCVIYTLNKIDYSVDNGDEKIQKYGGVTFEMQRRPNYVHESKREDIFVNQYYARTDYKIE